MHAESRNCIFCRNEMMCWKCLRNDDIFYNWVNCACCCGIALRSLVMVYSHSYSDRITQLIYSISFFPVFFCWWWNWLVYLCWAAIGACCSAGWLIMLCYVCSLAQLGPRRIHTIRTRGGNKKYRALRLDVGNFSWGSEGL